MFCVLICRFITLSHEVSCLDIYSSKTVVDNGLEITKTLVAVGLWMNISIKVLLLPDFTELASEPLGEG